MPAGLLLSKSSDLPLCCNRQLQLGGLTLKSRRKMRARPRMPRNCLMPLMRVRRTIMAEWKISMSSSSSVTNFSPCHVRTRASFLMASPKPWNKQKSCLYVSIILYMSWVTVFPTILHMHPARLRSTCADNSVFAVSLKMQWILGYQQSALLGIYAVL